MTMASIDDIDDFYVIVTRNKRRKIYIRRAKTLWSWEIVRRSKPLDVRLRGAGFLTEPAAKLAGEKALKEILHRLQEDGHRGRFDQVQVGS
jgi:hypothetical protein